MGEAEDIPLFFTLISVLALLTNYDRENCLINVGTEGLALVHSLGSDGQPSRQGWATLQWTEWQQQARSLEGVAAYSWTFNFLIGNDGSESLQGMAVTREYFSV
ncbi:MAG: hypothetical protein WBW33_32460, partial [Bryobacteraceae bacterium]